MTKVMGFAVSAELRARIETLARRAGVSRSEIIRRAIETADEDEVVQMARKNASGDLRATWRG